MTRAQQQLIAMSRALWIKPDGFVENGRFGTHFGTTAQAAAATLQQAGYRYNRSLNVYRRSALSVESGSSPAGGP